jgi:hypothetical protein
MGTLSESETSTTQLQLLREPREPPDFVRQEQNMREMDRSVLCLRLSVFFTLLGATAIVASAVYCYVKNDEVDDFNQEYESAVIKVAEGFQRGVDVKVLAAMTFSAMYTSRYGDDQSGARTWPNATMPDFQEQAEGQLLLAEGRALSFNPIITNKTRQEWEAHATESAPILGAESLVTRQDNSSRIVADGIFRTTSGAIVDDSGISLESAYPYTDVPVWQIAPIEGNSKAVMFNLHAEPNRQRALDDMLTYNVPTLTAILQLVQDSEIRPSSILFYPVRASFATSDSAKEVVGSISIVFSWDDVLRSILPDYLEGLVCVLETCTHTVGQTVTYSVAGDDVVFMGEGDLHDEEYDDMVHIVKANVKGTDEKLGVVDNLITYTLRVYPSKDFENSYVTNRPMIFTVSGVLIFLFTTLVFLLYDRLVKSRQIKLSKVAEQTSRIVNSMFPAAFRDRLFQHQESQAKDCKTDSPKGSASSLSLVSEKSSELVKAMKTFLVRQKPSGSKPGDIPEAPIADFFPETSIMFCDLAGFTAWSAQQTPNEVFKLLESIFWEFDQLAAEYNVFKLGTIGDCCKLFSDSVQNYFTMFVSSSNIALFRVNPFFLIQTLL